MAFATTPIVTPYDPNDATNPFNPWSTLNRFTVSGALELKFVASNAFYVHANFSDNGTQRNSTAAGFPGKVTIRPESSFVDGATISVKFDSYVGPCLHIAGNAIVNGGVGGSTLCSSKESPLTYDLYLAETKLSVPNWDKFSCIPDRAFQFGTGAINFKFTINSTLTYIGLSALESFRGNLKIAGSFPNLKTIGSRAFAHAGGPVTSVSMDHLGSLVKMNTHAFAGFNGLLQLEKWQVMHLNVGLQIPDSAFRDIPSPLSHINILSYGSTTIGAKSFFNFGGRINLFSKADPGQCGAIFGMHAFDNATNPSNSVSIYGNQSKSVFTKSLPASAFTNFGGLFKYYRQTTSSAVPPSSTASHTTTTESTTTLQTTELLQTSTRTKQLVVTSPQMTPQITTSTTTTVQLTLTRARRTTVHRSIWTTSHALTVQTPTTLDEPNVNWSTTKPIDIGAVETTSTSGSKTTTRATTPRGITTSTTSAPPTDDDANDVDIQRKSMTPLIAACVVGLAAGIMIAELYKRHQTDQGEGGCVSRCNRQPIRRQLPWNQRGLGRRWVRGGNQYQQLHQMAMNGNDADVNTEDINETYATDADDELDQCDDYEPDSGGQGEIYVGGAHIGGGGIRRNIEELIA
jgi:hypothetical protein